MPDDLVFADREGEFVIPRAAEAEVIGSALEKARTESKMAIAILNGMSACEAFSTFGVL